MTLLTKLRKENKKDSFLVKSILGVSPIPIIGEIALGSLFYDLLKESMEDMKYVSIPASLLVRYGLYTEFYVPLDERIIDSFK